MSTKILFAYQMYYEMLVPLEKALAVGNVRDKIREILLKTKGHGKSLDCLFYLVTRLYPDHIDMVEKLMILR